MQSCAAFAGIILASLAFFDLFAYYALRNEVRCLNSGYATAPDDRDLYERYLFVAHPTRGFDLAHNVKSRSHKPRETEPFDVWGNNLGCFDTDLLDTDSPEIYLAGDSFTFAFAPFDKKFGTLLEASLGVRVLKCGVTHTAQRHQFQKFKEIYEALNKKPRIVVVNYVANDIQGDYAFPHSTVIDGYLTEDSYVRFDLKTGKYELVRLTEHQLLLERGRRYQRYRNIRDLVKRYSATANILSYIKNWPRNNRLLDRLKTSSFVDPAYHHFARILELSGYTASYPFDSELAEENRKAILEWAAHSKKHGYTLLFSLIPKRASNVKDYYAELKGFLSKNGVPYFEFSKYLHANRIDPDSIYWKYDGHWNVFGNKVYADYLKEVLQPYLHTQPSVAYGETRVGTSAPKN